MRFYVYEICLDNSIYTELDASKYYVGKHQTDCKDLINDGYYGSGVTLWNLYDIYGYRGVQKRILKECDNEEDLILFEKYFIQKCKLEHGDNCINRQVSSKTIIIDENDKPKIVSPFRKMKPKYAFKWYTNGTVNLKIFEGNSIPDGFFPGFKFKEKTLSRKAREKSTKEFNKRQLKSIPLKERKQAYKQLKYDKLLDKEKKEFLREVHIPYIDRRIKECLRKGLNNIEIFDIVKLNENPHSQEFNKLLEDYILEQALIHQLSTMPNYLDTIYESLKELYKKNPLLQHRKDVTEYLISFFD